MKNSNRKNLLTAIWLPGAFILWTCAVTRIDVRPIGPGGSCVGFAALNDFVHKLTGVHFALYTLTDWLGLVPLGIAAGFAVLGLCQLIRRKSFLKVDRSLLILGGFYILVGAAYIFFEEFVINYRPVLIKGRLEASYPSSTTMLVLCVIPTAMLQFRERISRAALRLPLQYAFAAFALFMVAGRLISGVHWFTDIIGGALLSAWLVMLYYFACSRYR